MTTRTFGTKKTAPKTARLLELMAAVLVTAAFWLGLWAILALKTNSELLLPSPVAVLRRLTALAGTAELWQATGLSLLRILAGYLSGVLAGCVLAALTAWSRHAAFVLGPAGRIVKATPIASFIILALVWIPANNIPSFIVFLLVTPIIWEALKTALLSTDRQLLELARSMRFGRLKTILHVNVPSALPAFLSSLLTALGLAWKSGIAAEVLCLPKLSIGRYLYESKIYLETVDLFAWTALVIILSVIMEALIRLAVGRLSARGEWRTRAAVNAQTETEAEAETAVNAQSEAEVNAQTEAESAVNNEVPFSGAVAPALEISALSKAYGDNVVLYDLSLTVPEGAVCLTGPSGSGKTTLARILAGLEDADSGSVAYLFDGEAPNAAFMFQEPRLLPWKTALWNVLLAGSGRVDDARIEAAGALLTELGLEPQDAGKLPAELSGGMQQRVALARTAAFKRAYGSKLTILDEPLKGLDAATRRKAVAFIRCEFLAPGDVLILITHAAEDLAEFGGFRLELSNDRDLG